MPELVTEGDTLKHLRDRPPAVLPELIAPERLQPPHELHMVAFHESTVPVA